MPNVIPEIYAAVAYREHTELAYKDWVIPAGLLVFRRPISRLPSLPNLASNYSLSLLGLHC